MKSLQVDEFLLMGSLYFAAFLLLLSISQLKFPFYHRSPHKEYPMDSEAPTNLQHKIPLTEQLTPVNSLVFAGRGA